MTKPLLSLTLDVVFKSLFIKHPDLLISLLNSCLNFKGSKRIKSITINNSEVLPEEIHKKFIVVDIRATDHDGRKFNIEMQSRGQEFYNKRAAFYLCKVHVGDLKKGEEYDQIKPSYGIHFLNFIQYPDHEQKFHFQFQFREKTHPKLVLTDDLSLHLFELPKLRKKDYVGSKKDNLNMVEWVRT